MSFTMPMPVGPFKAAMFTGALTVPGVSSMELPHAAAKVSISASASKSAKIFLLLNFCSFFIFLSSFVVRFFDIYVLRILNLRHNVICIRKENIDKHKRNRKKPHGFNI